MVSHELDVMLVVTLEVDILRLPWTELAVIRVDLVIRIVFQGSPFPYKGHCTKEILKRSIQNVCKKNYRYHTRL